MVTYKEKLLDPRWQKKRLEIFQRDDFTCTECDSKEKTLNVHHLYYTYNKEPWDYPDDAFITLCEDCHQALSEYLESIKRFLPHMDISELRKIKAYIIYLKIINNYDGKFIEVNDTSIVFDLLFNLNIPREFGEENWVQSLVKYENGKELILDIDFIRKILEKIRTYEYSIFRGENDFREFVRNEVRNKIVEKVA